MRACLPVDCSTLLLVAKTGLWLCEETEECKTKELG
jgi:hypothetical protein